MKVIIDIKIKLKEGVQDKEGLIIANKIKEQGIDKEPLVNVARLYTFEIRAKNRYIAKNKAEEICKSMLMNTETEELEILRLIED